jgi:Zn-dependent protease
MLLLSLIQSPLTFIAFVVALLLAITVHEYAHAWAAYKSGDDTAKLMGRLTLNPIAHLDPLGTLFLFLVGFGWGKPVPTNPMRYHSKSSEIYVALAGIVTNILVAFVLAIPIRIALLTGHTIDSSQILSFLSIMVDINLVLAAFNILPIYPLDGSHIVEYFLSYQAKITYRQIGPMILFGIILLDRLSSYSILYAVMEPLIRLLSFLTKGTFSIFL